jgi:hypothetical protein
MTTTADIAPFTFFLTSTPIEIEAHLAARWPRWGEAAKGPAVIHDIAACISSHFSGSDDKRDVIVCVTNTDAEQLQHDGPAFVYDLSDLQIIPQIIPEKAGRGLLLYVSFLGAGQEEDAGQCLETLQLAQWQKDTYKVIVQSLADTVLPMTAQINLGDTLSCLSRLQMSLLIDRKAAAQQRDKTQIVPRTDLQQNIMSALGSVGHSLSALRYTQSIPSANDKRIRGQLNKLEDVALNYVTKISTPVTAIPAAKKDLQNSVNIKPALEVPTQKNLRAADIVRPAQPIVTRPFVAAAIAQVGRFAAKAKFLPQRLFKAQESPTPKVSLPVTDKVKELPPRLFIEPSTVTKITDTPVRIPQPTGNVQQATNTVSLPPAKKDAANIFLDTSPKPTTSPTTVIPFVPPASPTVPAAQPSIQAVSGTTPSPATLPTTNSVMNAFAARNDAAPKSNITSPNERQIVSAVAAPLALSSVPAAQPGIQAVSVTTAPSIASPITTRGASEVISTITPAPTPAVPGTDPVIGALAGNDAGRKSNIAAPDERQIVSPVAAPLSLPVDPAVQNMQTVSGTAASPVASPIANRGVSEVISTITPTPHPATYSANLVTSALAGNDAGRASNIAAPDERQIVSPVAAPLISPTVPATQPGMQVVSGTTAPSVASPIINTISPAPATHNTNPVTNTLSAGNDTGFTPETAAPNEHQIASVAAALLVLHTDPVVQNSIQTVSETVSSSIAPPIATRDAGDIISTITSIPDPIAHSTTPVMSTLPIGNDTSPTSNITAPNEPQIASPVVAPPSGTTASSVTSPIVNRDSSEIVSTITSAHPFPSGPAKHSENPVINTPPTGNDTGSTSNITASNEPRIASPITASPVLPAKSAAQALDQPDDAATAFNSAQPTATPNKDSAQPVKDNQAKSLPISALPQEQSGRNIPLSSVISLADVKPAKLSGNDSEFAELKSLKKARRYSQYGLC